MFVNKYILEFIRKYKDIQVLHVISQCNLHYEENLQTKYSLTNIIFCVMAWCSPVEVLRRFGRIYCLDLQVQ
jgi:hypothetical protein